MKKGIVSNWRLLLPLVAILWFANSVKAQQTARSTAGTSVTNCGGFYEYLPPSYSTSTANFPLIIFLHGVGELGDGTTQLKNVLANGIPKLINAGTFPASFTSGGKNFEFIVLSPQFKAWPSPADVLSLLNYAKTKYRIDNSRVYITGLSMGGGVTWNCASANDSYAAIPAAIVVVAGAQDPNQTPQGPGVIAKNNIPVWAFHNTGDPTVPVDYSKNWISMINAYVPAINPAPKLTLFNANAHDAWTKAYDPTYKENNMNVYEWMLQFQKGVPPGGNNNSGTAPQPPVANAGTAVTITLPTSTASLDGSASKTAAGAAVTSYLWKQNSGPNTSKITTTTAAKTTVTGLVAGSYVYSLIVKDAAGLADTATVTVKVNAAAQPPVANAGTAVTITLPTSSASLDGSASKTAAGAAVTSYQWKQTSGPNTSTITTATAAKTTVTGLVAGSYVYSLIVKDAAGLADTATVTVKVNAAANVAPVANAGTAITLTLPTNTTSLNGAGSKDSDGSIATYLWTQVSGPSTAVLTKTNTSVASAASLVAGSYVFQLKVTDNAGASATAQVTVKVNPAANVAPVANAGTAISLTLPTNTTSLNGSGSKDSDGSIATYLWTQVSGPSTAVLTKTNTSVASAASLVAGSYVFQLKVTDNAGASATAQVTVKVNAAAAPQAPVADAGTPVNVTLPTTTTTLDGSGSKTASGTAVSSYLWTQTSGPSASKIATTTAAKTSVTGLVQGSYTYQLKVTDNANVSATAQVAVTVSAAAASTGGRKITAVVNNKNGMYYPDAQTSFGLQPGDTLCIPAGDYEYIQLFNIHGTAAKPIVIQNCGGLVRLGINTHQSDIAFSLQTCSFIEVSGSGTPGLEYGFDINGKNLDGVEMQGMYFGAGSTDFDVHNMYIHDANILIVAKTTQFCDNPQYWEGKYVMNNPKFHHIKGRNSEYEGFYIGNTHYIITYADCGDVKSHHIQNLQVYDNDIENTGYDGIQLAMCDLGENLVHDNIVKNYGTQKLDAQSYGMIMGGVSRVKMYNNTIDGGYLPGIALFGSGISYCYNNTVANVTNGEGIQVADKLAIDPVTAYVYNNTIYNTGADGIKVYAYLTTIGHKVYNNLIINQGSTGDYPSPGMYIRGAQTIKFTYGNNMLFKTFAAAGIPNGAAGDYHLAAGSPAIDTGYDVSSIGLTADKDGVARPYNGKYDVGAYEYHAGTGNKAPTASAGSNFTITLPANTATLDGSGSKDGDGTIKTYAWTLVSGPSTPTITNAATAKASVAGLVQGTYIFQLKVTDDGGASATAQVTITVNPAAAKPPVANAGTAITITLPTSTASLDGSASKTAAGAAVSSYQWIQSSGPNTSKITTATSAKTTVTGLVAGSYVYSLIVKDAAGLADTATVTVKVNAAAAQPPVANAGTAITITLPTTTASLDGSASKTAAGGAVSSYLWSQSSGPNTSKITTTTAAKTTVTGLVAGSYVYTLIVKDANGLSDTATVTVKVNAAANVPPVANAGTTITLTLPTNNTTLNGSGSKDSDGSIASYQWTQVSGPTTAVFATTNTAVTSVSSLVQGSYVFQLTVKDNSGASSSAQVTVNVNAANSTISANAGADQTITAPTSTITLTGSATSTATITGYLWVEASGPNSVKFGTQRAATTAVSNLVPGTYVFELQATNADGKTATDQMTVTVNVAPNQPPVAVPGAAKTITLPVNSIVLSGLTSYDPDGLITGYYWRKVSGPDGGDVVNPNSGTITVSGMDAGTYVYSLTVTDDAGATNTANVTITVKPQPNSGNDGGSTDPDLTPVADAGTAQTVPYTTTAVTLNGAASHETGGSIVKYSWDKLQGPDVVFLNADKSVATAYKLVPSHYVFRLTVTDAQGKTATDTVGVTVTEDPKEANSTNVTVSAFPNPTVSSLTVAIKTPVQRVYVFLYDLSGRQVLYKSVTVNGSVNESLSLSSLPAGVYMLVLRSPDVSSLNYSTKIVKQ